MMWWAKTRMLPTLMLVTAVSTALCVRGVGLLVTLPSLTGGPSFASPISLLIPLAAVILYSHGLSRQNMSLEHQACRPIWWADVGAAATCVAIFALGLLVDHGDVMLGTLRNSIGYFGAALMGTWLFTQRTAALLPLAWALISSMGGLPLGEPSFWNWPSQPAQDAIAWTVPLVLGAVGPAAYLAHHATLTDRIAKAAAPERGK